MSNLTTITVAASAATAVANEFLLERVGDRFTTSVPYLKPDAHAWCCVVTLAYPVVGEVGDVGEIMVCARAGEVLSHTSVDEMHARARLLYEQHHERIEAAFAAVL